VDQDFGVVSTAYGAAVDHSFGHASKPQWYLNCVTVDYQTIAFKKIRMRSTSPYHNVRIEPEVTVLQLPPPPPEAADILPAAKQCMGLCYRAIAYHLSMKVLQLHCDSTRLPWCITPCDSECVLAIHPSSPMNRRCCDRRSFWRSVKTSAFNLK